ncbi:MAG: primosomal protein N' [Elusimicrobia bacterium]|nr:primosomal protein N' [Elusimicrobiota bacterium]
MEPSKPTNTPSRSSLRLAEVVYPLPLDRAFDYLIPPHLAQSVVPGVRTRAPFGPRKCLIGVVFAVKEEPPPGPHSRRLKSIEAVLDPEPLMTEEMLGMVRWLARRYCASIGECLRLVLPSELLSGKEPRRPVIGLPDPGAQPSPVSAEPIVLKPSQAAALERLGQALDAGTFSAHLLFGVPASGKTEVYLRLIRKAVGGEGQALFLVPEISLTRPFFDQFSAEMGMPVALWHSQLGARERRTAWRGLRSGSVRVVVGPRSAALLPFKKLRLVVMDEEQDESYKQDAQVPYYHARDVLLERARRFGAVAVLGSATPSVESFEGALSGALGLVEIPERVWEQTAAPPIRLSDLPAGSSRCIGDELLEAVKSRLQRREQTILLVNRRGFSNFIICRRCSWVARCPACEVAFIRHRDESSGAFDLRCHHCGRSAPVPGACGKCGKSALAHAGAGTQKVVSEIRALLPGARVLRMDSDTVSKESGQDPDAAIYRRFLDGEADVLVGTKLAAKGFHFPNVTLVGVVDADTMLQMPDFRSAERTVQMLLQAAGRAGRAERAGEVMIQTARATNYAIQAVARGDYAGFCREEIAHRRALRYPPVSSLIRLVFAGKTKETCLRTAETAAAGLRSALPADEVLGPAPGLLKRFKGRHRYHLLLKVLDASRAEAAFSAIRALAPSSAVRLKVNVDPYDFV